MNLEKQKENKEKQVISPLANDRTYGERRYSLIFDWGLNYWTNLLSSAAFSHWVEHTTQSIKIPYLKAATPRQIQKNLADWIAEGSLMDGLRKEITETQGKAKALEVVAERSMSRARSMTLLAPGFLIMIPSVWLGAKFKPAIVEWFNRRHYGDEAMNDPSLHARHQAIAAEARPTFLGAFTARMGTFFAAQATAQLIGSRENLINKLGRNIDSEGLKNFGGIDPVAESVGAALGGAAPAGIRAAANRFAKRIHLDWSVEQLKSNPPGVYNTATQDLARFIAADTMYTMVSASTIRPFLRVLKHVPGMSYLPKEAANSPTFDGDEKIKVPANSYGFIAPGINDTKHAPERPRTRISHAQDRETIMQAAERNIA